MNTAAKVREAKEKNPEKFCHDPRCLWRTVTRDGIKPCPKHPAPAPHLDHDSMVKMLCNCGPKKVGDGYIHGQLCLSRNSS